MLKYKLWKFFIDKNKYCDSIYVKVNTFWWKVKSRGDVARSWDPIKIFLKMPGRSQRNKGKRFNFYIMPVVTTNPENTGDAGIRWNSKSRLLLNNKMKNFIFMRRYNSSCLNDRVLLMCMSVGRRRIKGQLNNVLMEEYARRLWKQWEAVLTGTL